MRKILIADSLPAMCDALERALRQEFSVMSCSDGQTAQELLCSFQPDVLIIDLSIAVVDGLQVISNARLSGRDIQILATTVSNSPYILSRLRHPESRIFLQGKPEQDCIVKDHLPARRLCGTTPDKPDRYYS